MGTILKKHLALQNIRIMMPSFYMNIKYFYPQYKQEEGFIQSLHSVTSFQYEMESS